MDRVRPHIERKQLGPGALQRIEVGNVEPLGESIGCPDNPLGHLAVVGAKVCPVGGRDQLRLEYPLDEQKRAEAERNNDKLPSAEGKPAPYSVKVEVLHDSRTVKSFASALDGGDGCLQSD